MKNKIITLILSLTCMMLTACNNTNSADAIKTVAETIEKTNIETVEETTIVEIETTTEEAVVAEEGTTVEEITTDAVVANDGAVVEVTELPELVAGETVNITSDNFCSRSEGGGISLFTGYNGNISYNEGLGFTSWINVDTCETWTIIADKGYKYTEKPEFLSQYDYTKKLVVSQVLTGAIDNGDGTSVFEVVLDINGETATGDLIINNADKSFVSFNGSNDITTYNYSVIDTIPSLPDISFEEVSYERINELILENFF